VYSPPGPIEWRPTMQSSRGQSALAGHGLDAGDVELQCAQLLDALIVAKALLEAQTKELLGGLGLLGG